MSDTNGTYREVNDPGNKTQGSGGNWGERGNKKGRIPCVSAGHVVNTRVNTPKKISDKKTFGGERERKKYCKKFLHGNLNEGAKVKGKRANKGLGLIFRYDIISVYKRQRLVKKNQKE